MKKILVSALIALGLSIPASAQSTAAITVLTPGVTYFAGVLDLAAGYQKEKGTKVNIQLSGMGKILSDAKTATEPADIVFLPVNLMNQLEAEKGIVPGSRIPIGRVRMALAVHKGDPIPDISTVEKLAAVLKSADSVLRSNPVGGSMVASIIETMLKRPEFAGVKSRISPFGEGGQAVMRGEGQMAIQAECEILNHPDHLFDAGPVPDELGAYMDMVAAVSIRSPHPKDAAAWLKYATQPGTYSLWLGRGLERVK
jgi:molybdate transport system substrate-binding protein